MLAIAADYLKQRVQTDGRKFCQPKRGFAQWLGGSWTKDFWHSFRWQKSRLIVWRAGQEKTMTTTTVPTRTWSESKALAEFATEREKTKALEETRAKHTALTEA